MPLVVAKCTQCGTNIEVDDTNEAEICKHCGTAFVTEKAINNYNAYIENDIKEKVVNTYNTSKDFIIKAGKLVEYNGKSKIVIIPSDVNIIGSNAFSEANWENHINGSSINKIFIPASVVELNKMPFAIAKTLLLLL